VARAKLTTGSLAGEDYEAEARGATAANEAVMADAAASTVRLWRRNMDRLRFKG